MPIDAARLAESIVAAKTQLRAKLPQYARAFAGIEEHVKREVDDILERTARGEPVVPQIDYQDVAGGRVDPALSQAIRRRGGAVIRQVFPRTQAREWNAELCGAEPARALSANAQWHGALLPGLVSIPRVEPGDTAWWHPDLVHAVEGQHRGTGFSNVMYIGAAPYCAKNAAYLEKQKPAFLTGESSPDFAAENYEVAYKGRATPADLTELGRRQMGFSPW